MKSLGFKRNITKKIWLMILGLTYFWPLNSLFAVPPVPPPGQTGNFSTIAAPWISPKLIGVISLVTALGGFASRYFRKNRKP